MFAKLTASHLRRHTRWLGINTRFVIYEIVRSIHVSEADTQGVPTIYRENLVRQRFVYWNGKQKFLMASSFNLLQKSPQFTERGLDVFDLILMPRWRRRIVIRYFGWKLWTTFQDVPFISKLSQSVEPKLSHHLHSEQSLWNFRVNGKQPQCWKSLENQSISLRLCLQVFYFALFFFFHREREMRIAARNEALQTATEQLQLKIQQKVKQAYSAFKNKMWKFV